MRTALREYNEHRALSSYPPIRMGIGLHRGPLMLGTIGENRRMDSTVISDTVNTSSRLEGLTKKFMVDILVSEETIDGLAEEFRSEFVFTFVSEETVKGRKQSLRVYSLASNPVPSPV
ncbi:MAG: adenylate/guanylate cyclase domain-containing protein [Spirochaetales bacterium]